jgi:hypothetical protein
MMTKFSIIAKIIVAFMVVAALVAASWDFSTQQPESKRSLRVGQERKLQTMTTPFSSFGIPSQKGITGNPGLMKLPTGGNKNGVTGKPFGDNSLMQTFFGTAGNSSGGVINFPSGGKIQPLVFGSVPNFQVNPFVVPPLP